MDETLAIYLAPTGRDGDSGAIDQPIQTLAGIAWPDKGSVSLFLEEGHSVGDLQVPPGLDQVSIYPFRNRRNEGLKSGPDRWRVDVATKKPLQEGAHPVVSDIASASSLVVYNTHVMRDVDVTLQGVMEKGEVAASKRCVLVHCRVYGDWDTGGCEAAQCVSRHTAIVGDVLLVGNKAPGRVHMQHTVCRNLVYDDETSVEVILGSTDLDPDSTLDGKPHYGQPVDCCTYSGFKHVVAGTGKANMPAVMAESLKERGNGVPRGKIWPSTT